MLRKTLSIILSVVFCFGMLTLTASADDSVTASLRVEGIENCLFYDDVTVNNGSTVYDVLLAADKADDSLTVISSSSQYGAYVTSINGITAGSYTALKWDGWLFMVNNESPTVGMDALTVNDDDEIVIYYGDPYDTGMQYPEVSFDAATGTFTLTSLDTVYDEQFNATTEECPVSGYTLYWEADGKVTEFTADENGTVVIGKEYLTYGKHKVSYEKTAKNGLPLILRAAPDFTVEIPDNRNIFEKLFDYIKAFFDMIISFFNSISG